MLSLWYISTRNYEENKESFWCKILCSSTSTCVGCFMLLGLDHCCKIPIFQSNLYCTPHVMLDVWLQYVWKSYISACFFSPLWIIFSNFIHFIWMRDNPNAVHPSLAKVIYHCFHINYFYDQHLTFCVPLSDQGLLLCIKMACSHSWIGKSTDSKLTEQWVCMICVCKS